MSANGQSTHACRSFSEQWPCETVRALKANLGAPKGAFDCKRAVGRLPSSVRLGTICVWAVLLGDLTSSAVRQRLQAVAFDVVIDREQMRLGGLRACLASVAAEALDRAELAHVVEQGGWPPLHVTWAFRVARGESVDIDDWTDWDEFCDQAVALDGSADVK